MIRIRKTVSEGCQLPWGYGVAWDEPWRCTAVCYPFPLNHILGLLRNFYWSILHNRSDHIQAMWQNGYDKGYETGYNQGRESRIAEAIAGLKAEMPKTFGKSLE